MRTWCLLVGAACMLLAGTVRAMTVDDVTELLQAGVREQVILDQMRADGSHFDLSTQDIIDLTRAGASDDLIREMIRRESADNPSSDWTEGYYAPSLSMGLYYDPFAYYWCTWPTSFSYYYPFRWCDAGFYYAGWWNRRGWGAGVGADYYWDRYHWGAGHDRFHGRSAWSRNPGTTHPGIWTRGATLSRPGATAHRTQAPRSSARPTGRTGWSRQQAPDPGAYGRSPRGTVRDGASSRPPARAVAPSRPRGEPANPAGHARSGWHR